MCVFITLYTYQHFDILDKQMTSRCVYFIYFGSSCYLLLILSFWLSAVVKQQVFGFLHLCTPQTPIFCSSLDLHVSCCRLEVTEHVQPLVTLPFILPSVMSLNNISWHSICPSHLCFRCHTVLAYICLLSHSSVCLHFVLYLTS